MEQTQKPKRFRDLFDWLEALTFAIVLVVLLFSFVLRLVRVEGESMLQTLVEGDRILVSALFYEPEAGDIVVLNKPNFSSRPFVKRIIATGGQTVDIDFESGDVFVDGALIEEPYINNPTHREEDMVFPLTVPEGSIFVMGDNRDHSTDSRSTLIGTVDERYIMGRALFRLYPLNKIGVLP